MFPPLFVADTKIIYGYNFAAALKSVSLYKSQLKSRSMLKIITVYYVEGTLMQV